LRNSSMFMTEKSGSSSSLKLTGKLLKYNNNFQQIYFGKIELEKKLTAMLLDCATL
jgi:hypothetical protein